MTTKTFNFGKIDFYGTGRKVNAVDVEVRWEDGTLSICAFVWNARHTDIITGGQCLDSLLPFKGDLHNDKVNFEEVYRLWDSYHLNDMHAGTREQESALKDAGLSNASDYDKACEYLDKLGLYEVPMQDGSTYRYGTGWLKEEIPSDDTALIESIMAA